MHSLLLISIGLDTLYSNDDVRAPAETPIQSSSISKYSKDCLYRPALYTIASLSHVQLKVHSLHRLFTSFSR